MGGDKGKSQQKVLVFASGIRKVFGHWFNWGRRVEENREEVLREGEGTCRLGQGNLLGHSSHVNPTHPWSWFQAGLSSVTEAGCFRVVLAPCPNSSLKSSPTPLQWLHSGSPPGTDLTEGTGPLPRSLVWEQPTSTQHTGVEAQFSLGRVTGLGGGAEAKWLCYPHPHSAHNCPIPAVAFEWTQLRGPVSPGDVLKLKLPNLGWGTRGQELGVESYLFTVRSRMWKGAQIREVRGLRPEKTATAGASRSTEGPRV